MLTNDERQRYMEQIGALPDQVDELVRNLTDHQLTTHFLADEWSVAQNVHHLADSHMNSYIRCKLIATEDHPTLKPYDQAAWATFADATSPDISASLQLLRSLHTRWVVFWKQLPDDGWERTGYHPDNGDLTLDHQLQTYAAHGMGHLDQMRRTLAAEVG